MSISISFPELGRNNGVSIMGRKSFCFKTFMYYFYNFRPQHLQHFQHSVGMLMVLMLILILADVMLVKITNATIVLSVNNGRSKKIPMIGVVNRMC